MVKQKRSKLIFKESNKMKRLLLLSIILLTACDQEILFDEQGNNNSYLSCYSISDDVIESGWRNVILDKTNQSIKSERYTISHDFKGMQYGDVFVMNDSYDDSEYRWGEHTGTVSNKFELHKTTLNLKVIRRLSTDNGDSYDRLDYECGVYDDYQSYLKWEKSILESLEIEGIRQKIQSERVEANKKI